GCLLYFCLFGKRVFGLKTSTPQYERVLTHLETKFELPQNNLSKDFSRINLDISVSYNADIDKVIAVINKVGIELAQDPEWKDRIISPPQFIRLDNFADSALILKINCDVQPLKQWEVSGEMRKRLKFAFDKEGIEIPFPQLVVHGISK
ncbi:MAG TPA: mechanosensitive ion channel family protein, partial [Bacteroidales bacterium]|nr:mechanosensitive ion channel family protein [Bacteroidales bacterium]